MVNWLEKLSTNPVERPHQALNGFSQIDQQTGVSAPHVDASASTGVSAPHVDASASTGVSAPHVDASASTGVSAPHVDASASTGVSAPHVDASASTGVSAPHVDASASIGYSPPKFIIAHLFASCFSQNLTRTGVRHILLPHRHDWMQKRERLVESIENTMLQSVDVE